MTAVEPLVRASEDTATGAPISCDLYTDLDGMDRLRDAWDDAVLRTSGSIYMTFDWVSVWWRFYGKAAALRVFVFTLDGRIVALLPMYVDTIGWGPLGLRVARIVGANIPPKVFNPPVPEAYASVAIAEVLTHLFVRDRCDVVSFGPVSDTEHWRDTLRAWPEGSALVARSETTAEVHSTYHLPADMDAYYGSLRQSERKNRRKYELRLLEKEFDTRVEVISAAESVPEAFERFAEQHREQWRAEGRTGHFGAWPAALDFNRALVKAHASRGRVRFIRIVAGESVVAEEYAFVMGDRYYAELTARAVESQWDRFSLGPTSTVRMLAHAIAEGMTRVESGLGHYDYKVRLGAQEHAALTCRLVSSRLGSRLRVALFSAVRDGLRLAYLKVWYRRIVPRLPPSLWRPQLRFWLRLDF